MPKGIPADNKLNDRIRELLELRLSYRKIVKILGEENKATSCTHVARIAGKSKLHRQSQVACTRGKAGRPPVITERGNRRLLWLAGKEPRISAAKAKEQLGLKGHERTVRRHLKQAELKTVKEICFVRQQKGDAKRRKQWVSDFLKQYKAADHQLILAVDEKYFPCDGPPAPRLVHWNTRLPRPVRAKTKYGGGGVSVWIGICSDSFVGPFFKQGMFNADDIARCFDCVLPTVFANYVLDDNYSPHRTEDVTRLTQDYGVSHLLPPARSPDINFAEQVLGVLSNELYRIGTQYTDTDGLEDAIQKTINEWKANGKDKSLFQKIIQKWPIQLQSIVDRNGGPGVKV